MPENGCAKRAAPNRNQQSYSRKQLKSNRPFQASEKGGAQFHPGIDQVACVSASEMGGICGKACKTFGAAAGPVNAPDRREHAAGRRQVVVNRQQTQHAIKRRSFADAIDSFRSAKQHVVDKTIARPEGNRLRLRSGLDI